MSLVKEISKKYPIDPKIEHGMDNLDKLEFQELMELKNAIEKSLNEYVMQLRVHDPNDANVTVIDDFPRSDIDIVEVKVLRKNILMLQNDQKKLVDYLYVYINEKSPLAKNN